MPIPTSATELVPLGGMIGRAAALVKRSEVLRRSARVLGLRYTFRVYAADLMRPDSHAYDDPFDSRWSAETSGEWDYEKGALPPEIDGAVEGYEGTRVDVVRHAFGLLPLEASTTELWDLGSGKGRVTILAAEAGFRRVVGVELNEELHQLAELNVERARARFPDTAVELMCQSAAAIRLPDEPVVVFMFNPFRGHLFAAVVEQLENRARRSDEPLWLIYVNPRERALLAQSPHFELVAEEKVNPSWWTVNIYRAN